MKKKLFVLFIKRLVLVLMLMSLTGMIYSNNQQKKTVTGKVVDNMGISLPGVTVMVKGTTDGTITDVDGEFTLQIDPASEFLLFTYVGMMSQEVSVGSKSVFNITLLESAVNLDELVVVGYGTMKKSDLTGSVSRIDSKSIEEMAATQITEALSGTVAGLYTTQGTKASGGGSLELRGPTSLAATTSPLIVLDGVIFNGSISEINPSDIESIDVLRDASSTAIFGARAATGVITITTKRGKVGKPTINFSAKIGIASTTNDFYPYGLDPDGDPMDYFRMHRDLLHEWSRGDYPDHYYWHPDNLPSDISRQDWLNYSENPVSDPQTEWFNRLGVWPTERENYLAGQTTDFYGKVIGTGLRQDYNMSVGGATDNLRYYFSLGYLDNEGIIKGDEFQSIRARINLDLDVTDWLTVGTNTHFSNRDESVVEGSLGQLARMSPYGSMWQEDGSLKTYPNDYELARNPLENYYGQDRLRDINSLFSVLYGELKLPFGITFRTSFQPSFSFTKDYNFWSSNTSTGSNTYKGGYGQRDNTNSYGWMMDNLLKWNQTFGIHNFDVTLLANAERNKSWFTRAASSEYAPSENLGYNALQFGGKPGVSSNDIVSSGDALMARLNYTLMDKYLLTASIRRDGYSAFGQLNPRATFPAFAFAWKISEESFYNISWMERMKLRLSWGENGNREIGAYSALAQMSPVTLYDGSNLHTGVYNSRLSNRSLVWERTRSYNVGFDIGLLSNRIDLSVDAYQSETFDLLLNRQLPRITGFNSITSNLGVLANKGIELTVNSVNINQKNLTWRSTFVYSVNRNKIKELWGDYGDFTLLNEERYGELPDLENKWFPGYARDVIWDYERDGIWQLNERDEAAKYGLEPGDYKAIDVNGDGKYTQFEDKKFIGHSAPRHRLGLKNSFDFFNNFSASFFLRADLGHLREVPIMGNRSAHDRYNDWGWGYWSPENPDSEFARNMYPDNWGRFGGGLKVFVPTGFVRLQDLSISYQVPEGKVHQMLSVKGIKVTLSGRNLLTFTDWVGFDPESGLTPMQKTFTFGIDIQL